MALSQFYTNASWASVCLSFCRWILRPATYWTTCRWSWTTCWMSSAVHLGTGTCTVHTYCIYTVNSVTSHAFALIDHYLSCQFPEPDQRLHATDGVSTVPDQRTAQCQQQKSGGGRLWQYAKATHGFPGWKVSELIKIWDSDCPSFPLRILTAALY